MDMEDHIRIVGIDHRTFLVEMVTDPVDDGILQADGGKVGVAEPVRMFYGFRNGERELWVDPFLPRDF